MPDDREFALFLWIGIFLVVGVSLKGVRPSLLKLVSLVLWSRLTVVALIAAVWLALACAGLWGLGLVDASHLKTAILWFILAGTPIVFSGISQKNPNRYFREIIGEQFKLLLFFELLVNAYPFPLWGEVVLAGVAGILGVFTLATKINPKAGAVEKLANASLAILGFFLLLAVAYHLWQDPGKIFSRSGLEDFCLPIYFAFIMLPYAYMLTVFSGYESLFSGRLGRHAQMSEDVRRYMQTRVFLVCGMNANRVRRAARFAPFELRWAATRESVDREITNLRQILAAPEPAPEREDAIGAG